MVMPMSESATVERPKFHFDVVTRDVEHLQVVLRHGGEDYRWVWRNGKAMCVRDLSRLTGVQKHDMTAQAHSMLEKDAQRQEVPVERVAS